MVLVPLEKFNWPWMFGLSLHSGIETQGCISISTWFLTCIPCVWLLTSLFHSLGSQWPQSDILKCLDSIRKAKQKILLFYVIFDASQEVTLTQCGWNDVHPVCQQTFGLVKTHNSNFWRTRSLYSLWHQQTTSKMHTTIPRLSTVGWESGTRSYLLK